LKRVIKRKPTGYNGLSGSLSRPAVTFWPTGLSRLLRRPALERFGVDHPHGLATREGRDRRRHVALEGLEDLAGGVAQVRGQGDVVQPAQGMIGWKRFSADQSAEASAAPA
jgi:hypothetical protein